MKTLIIIDVQNDFMPGGPLEVPYGNDIVPVINKIQSYFDLDCGDPGLASGKP